MHVKDLRTSSDSIDLVLLVQEVRSNGHPVLQFYADASRPEFDRRFGSFESRALQGDIEAHLEAFFESLENQSLDSKKDQQTAARRQRSIGLRLGRQLLPKNLRRLLLTLRERIETLQIVSSAAWIPWELLAIEDPDEPSRSFFLAEAFALCRWLGESAATVALPLRRIAVVSPEDSGLQHVADECATLLAQHRGSERRAEPVAACLQDVLEAMDSKRFDAWHVSGHGLARDAVPDQWSIQLEGRECLQSVDLESVRSALLEVRPFVFLNACRSGRGGRGLVDAGGLGPAFVEAGAGAFVGATWAIDDVCASAFAAQLYAELAAGWPLGEAVRRARLWLREAYPANPTWLAYAVYGHPQARIQPRESPAEPVAAEEARGSSATPGAPYPHPSTAESVARHQPRSTARRGPLLTILCIGAVLAMGTWVAKQGLTGRLSNRASETQALVQESTPADPPNQQIDTELSGSPVNKTGSGLPKSPENHLQELPTPASESPPPTPLAAVPYMEQLTVRERETAHSDRAAISLSIAFQHVRSSRFVRLTIAPDGQTEEKLTVFDNGSGEREVEAPTGKWLIQVLSIRRSQREVTIKISEVKS